MQQALDALKAWSFVVESSGSRVMRYAHNVERVLAIPPQSVALLATLMLRGPQTAGELRINGDRLHRFADLSAVEGFLRELEARPTGALVAELPRSPGTRETRWRHLLSGDEAIAAETFEPATAAKTPAPDLIELQDAVAVLRTDVDALQATVAALRAELTIRQHDPER